MKKNLLIISAILISIFSSNAQKYQTVKSNRIALFANQNQTIKSVRIDSAIFKTDSILYCMPNIYELNDMCFTPNGISWIGEKVVIQSNGYNIFYNKKNEIIKIKTDAKLNESWTAFDLLDSIKIIATVIKFDTLHFIGQIDSVKTIEFQAFDKLMTPITHQLNDMSISFSKNYGFIKTLNFRLFPNFESLHYNEHLEIYNLVGLSNPKIGVQNLKMLDVFDFQVGDELHLVYEYEDWNPYTNNVYATSKKTIHKYLERTDDKNSVTYRIDRIQSTLIRTTTWDNTTFEYLHDTIETSCKSDSLFDKLPDEPFNTDDKAYSNLMQNGKNPSKIYRSMDSEIYHSNDNCWKFIYYDGCISDNVYIKGLGGPYYNCTNTFSFGGIDNSLVYYKKGTTTWGSPLVITVINDPQSNENIVIYPNPIVDFIYFKGISSTKIYSFELINMHGQLVFKTELKSNTDNINIMHINKGVYLYRILNGDSIINSGKIIKLNRTNQ